MTAAPELAQGPPGSFSGTRLGRYAQWLLRWGIPALLLLYIGRRLSEVGWQQVWTARPAHPGFYALLIAQYFVQPLGDLLVYRNLWGVANMPPPSVILRKRFLNTFLLDYSGEAYFYFWARRNLQLAPAMLIHAIKDSNILSAGAGLAMLWLMLLLLLATGGLQVPQLFMGHGWLYAVIGSAPLLLCGALVLGHRKLTTLGRGQIATTFAIHFLRSLTVLAVEFALWLLSGALPSTVACIQFVMLRLVITRLPLVSNKDLILVGAGIAAAGLIKAPVAPVAAVLVVLAAADLLIGCTVAGLPWALEHLRGGRSRDGLA